jgi:hypothetical protein
MTCMEVVRVRMPRGCPNVGATRQPKTTEAIVTRVPAVHGGGEVDLITLGQTTMVKDIPMNQAVPRNWRDMSHARLTIVMLSLLASWTKSRGRLIGIGLSGFKKRRCISLNLQRSELEPPKLRGKTQDLAMTDLRLARCHLASAVPPDATCLAPPPRTGGQAKNGDA